MYIYGNRIWNYFKQWIAMSSFAQIPAWSIALPVISSFVIPARHSLSQVFVTLTMNHMIFLWSNKIMCP